jgi:hypothetical protein
VKYSVYVWVAGAKQLEREFNDYFEALDYAYKYAPVVGTDYQYRTVEEN